MWTYPQNNNCSVVVILSAFAKIHYKLTLSLYCTPVTCFLRENVGGSEKNRLITGADVRTGDLLPSKFTHARTVLSTGQRLRRRRTAGCWPTCQRGASSSRLCHGPRRLVQTLLHQAPNAVIDWL